MGKNIYLGIFKEWLIKKNILDSFLINGGDFKSLGCAKPFDYIMCAFVWGDVSDKKVCWSDYNVEWKEFYNSLILIKKTKLSKKLYPKAIEYKNYLVVHNC